MSNVVWSELCQIHGMEILKALLLPAVPIPMNGRQREGESSSRIGVLLGRTLGSNSCEEGKEAEVAEWVEEVRLLMWLQCRSQLTMQGRLRMGWGCRTFLSVPKAQCLCPFTFPGHWKWAAQRMQQCLQNRFSAAGENLCRELRSRVAYQKHSWKLQEWGTPWKSSLK